MDGEWPYQSWGINRDPNACLTLCDLKKAEGPSPFPALTQIEAWGVEAP